MEAKGNFPYSGLVEVVVKVESHHLGSVSSRVLSVDDKVSKKKIQQQANQRDLEGTDRVN